MTKRHISVIFLVIALIVCSPAPAQDAPPARKGVKFTSDKCTLTVTGMDMKSAMKFYVSPSSTHSVELEGHLKVPDGLDVVALQQILKVGRTIDAEERSVKALQKTGALAKRYKTGTYTWVGEKTRIGEVEMKRMELKANPYTIASLEVISNLVVAVEKAEKELPATVMDKARTIVPGLKIRLTGLSSKRKGTYLVSGEFERSAAGPSGAFVESVFCLDKAGKSLGGGRFVKGDPMGTKGKLSCSFSVRDATAIASLKFVIVTKSEIKPVTFTLKDIFQK